MWTIAISIRRTPGMARWAASGGVPGTIYDAATNRIYVASGNGLFDANMTGDFEWGDSVLALNPDGTGSGFGMPVDSYTPSNYGTLYGNDTDLGSTAPAILPAGFAALGDPERKGQLPAPDRS